jgi:hypothetical protein
MSKSTTVITKKKRGPAPTGIGTFIGVRLQPDLLAALDAFIADELDSPSRPEAIRRLVADHPAMQSYLSGKAEDR